MTLDSPHVRRLESPALALVLLLPALALAHGVIPPPPPLPAILLVSGGLWMVPGWLLLRRLPGIGPVGLLEALPLAFALGLSVFVAEAILALLLGIPYTGLCDLSAAVSLGLACGRGDTPVRIRRMTRGEWLILLAGVGCATLAYHLGGYQPAGTDTWYHIAKLRRMAGMSHVAETEVWFQGTPVSPSYGYNAWHVGMAALTRFSSLDAFTAWFWVLPPLVLLQVGAYYAFAKALFEEASAAFCAAFLFLAFLALDARGMSWVAAAVPFPMAHHLLFFPAMALALRSKEVRGPSLPLAAGFVGGSSFMVHAFTPFYLLLALGGLASTTLLFRRSGGRDVRALLMACLFTAVFALPYGAVRARAYRPVGTYYLPAESDKRLRLTDGTYIVHPRYMRRMPFRIAGLLLFPLALAALKRRRWALYCAAGTAIPPLLTLNPLLVPVVAERLSLTFVSRTLVLMPAVEVCAAVGCGVLVPAVAAWWTRHPRARWKGIALVLPLALIAAIGTRIGPGFLLAHRGAATTAMAWGIGLLQLGAMAMVGRAAWSRGERWPRGNPFAHPPAPRLAMGSALGLAVLVGLLALPPMVRDYRNPVDYLTPRQASDPGGWMGFLKAAPGPSVVLADESLSSRIPALTGHYVVATSYSHDPVADWEARRSLVRAALSRGHDWAEVRAGLDRYGVDYVVATPGPETEEPIRRLDGHPERFRRCYEGEGVVIWRRLA